MEQCRPSRPGDTTSAVPVCTPQELALNGGDQPPGLLVAGQSMGSGNKGISETERCP